MSNLSRSGLAAGIILAVSCMTDVAYGGVEKFFITGNPTTCLQVFSALETQHPSVFGSPSPPATQGPFQRPVRAEILVEPLTGLPVTRIGSQTVSVAPSADQTSFNWTEMTQTPLGFDVVSIKAGNGRTVYVYVPDGTAGTNLSDLNTTQKITSVLFCADSNVTIVGNPFCDLTSTELAPLCSAAGNMALVEIRIPGASGSQICACPGVTIAACNPSPVCDPVATDCETVFPGGFCDPASPDVANSDLTETACCVLSPFTEHPLTLTGAPETTSGVNAIGTCCYILGTLQAAGGTGTATACLKGNPQPDPPCP